MISKRWTKRKKLYEVFEKKMKGLEFITAEPCYLFGIIGSFIVLIKNTKISQCEIYQVEGIFWHKVGMSVERLHNM